ncbi:MAG: DNA recombination protein RmuC [Sphingopyxis sp.]|nr:MAG: DNA recombination protein RmuC [Sphingopyxis sp.]
MQSIEWTTEVIVLAVIASIICAALGYLLASVIQTKKSAALTAKLEQVQSELEKTLTANASLQARLSEAEQEKHQQQLQESALRGELSGAQATSQRLEGDLEQRRQELASLGQRLEQAVQQQHAAQTQSETALADLRASKEQVNELRERLQAAESKAQNLQDDTARVKDELAAEGKRVKGLEIVEQEVRLQLEESKASVNRLSETLQQAQDRFQKLSSEHTELKTTLQKTEQHFKEQMAQFAETKASLTQEFENLANRIFEEKGKTFTQTSQASIDGMLRPFREQIEGFQKRINDVHDASLQGNSSLNAEIRKVLDIGLQMSKEANNLTSALKGDSQQRGAWGEAQLRRTLEMSGLVEEAHFEVQSAFNDAEGKPKQTDYLIKIPDGKHIIIDSKVSLVAYDRAVSAESPDGYKLAMAEHVKAVRKHIDDLASKDYTNLVGMRSPSFVLMFMPIEPAYIEAMKHNKDLFEYGYKKGIVLVSHTTLIPILRTVSNLWMIERSNAEAREISEKAGDIYNQVCTVAERLSKLGGTLSTVSNHYNSTVKALAGQQGLYGKVERFNQLSAKVSKTLPAMEPAHMDFESERLSLIVEALDDDQELEASTPLLTSDQEESDQHASPNETENEYENI